MRSKAAVLVLSCILVFTGSCSSIKKNVPVQVEPGISVKTPKLPVHTPGLSASDILEEDEYLVADDGTSDWAAVGKMLTPPSAVEAEAEFLMYYNSQKEWKRFFVKLKPATSAAFTTGNDVFYYGGNEREGVYHLPKDRSSAREGSWYRGLITDTSLLASRGVVYVAGTRVDKNNVFIVAK